ncbi:PepSY-associated TM helix domain-containing protein [Gloeobacter violaceus]|uniref:Gll0342 protein n=1 Tax=Gloeobacter violaceus (strain ATCC 29082 / PCC 7421) TaxID=251221 RepID=Q7NNR8_GLOVI|nr:PepSY-associated TM helix domain-containing protein [Gloeobacter violaceus]BAC88283.1 gll0342 [Gloeobacter violaceus PCC 7421]
MKRHRLLFHLHRVTGLLAGILIAILGLTGSSIVFWKELDHALYAPLFHVVPQGQKVPLDRVVATVKQAHPKSDLESVQLPQQPHDPYMMNLKRGEEYYEVHANPYTGELLGARRWDQTPIGYLYQMHNTLLLGETGELVVGLCGLWLLLLGGSGLLLWPGWKKPATGFRVRWRSPSPLLQYDLHKITGIFSAALLMISGLTGALIILLHLVPSLFFAMIGYAPQPAEATSRAGSNRPPMPLEALLDRADAALPEGRALSIALLEGGSVQVRKHIPPAPFPEEGLSTVDLDGYTGRVLAVQKVAEPTPGIQVLALITTLHFGSFGGLPTRILYVLLGLTPSLLLATGLLRRLHKLRLERVKSRSAPH